jgi:hypothetical protein
MAPLGCFELIRTDRSRHTHRTQVRLYEAHGIPWLEYNNPNPTCKNVQKEIPTSLFRTS